VLCELGRDVGMSTCCRVAGSRLECRGYRLVGRQGAATEMERVLFRIRDQRGEPFVNDAPLVIGGNRVDE
jgi:hypothetical protein